MNIVFWIMIGLALIFLYAVFYALDKCPNNNNHNNSYYQQSHKKQWQKREMD